jgi:hypothetical protein
MQEFHIPLKSDMIDVSRHEEREQAIKKMLAEFDKGSVIRHEYVDHDICFFNAIKLDGEKFDQELGTILRGEA